MYYSYVEIEYVARIFSPPRTDLALKLLTVTFTREINSMARDVDSYQSMKSNQFYSKNVPST
jgi:hypothetical protein